MLEKFQSMPQHIVASHPGHSEGVSYELSFAFKRLTGSGISSELTAEILKLADEVLPAEQKKKKAFVEGWLIKYFLDHFKVAEQNTRGRYQVFVGPTGQGKTTTIIKLASHLILKEKKRVAILSGDNIKVGASNQLKTYANILNVPFGAMSGDVDWLALDEQLENVDVILIDTPGSTLKGASEIDAIKRCIPQFTNADIRLHFVQSIMTRDADAFEVAARYKIFNYDDVIFTRLDEAVQFGLIYNFMTRFNVPVHSFGIGSAMPEAYEFASRERFVDLLFHLSKPQVERGQR
jgi:flagellar biosynthesis protein FlhF